MAALEASVKAAKDARKRHPAGGPERRGRPGADATAKRRRRVPQVGVARRKVGP